MTQHTIDLYLQFRKHSKVFSTFQVLRHSFVPGSPACIADIANTKVSLERSSLPIDDKLKDLFPTLLTPDAEGKVMQQLEIKVDEKSGSIIKSDTPLKVRTQKLNSSHKL